MWPAVKSIIRVHIGPARVPLAYIVEPYKESYLRNWFLSGKTEFLLLGNHNMNFPAKSCMKKITDNIESNLDIVEIVYRWFFFLLHLQYKIGISICIYTRILEHYFRIESEA